MTKAYGVRATSPGVPFAVCSTCRLQIHPELESSVPVLVDIWALWCGPCRMVSPLVEKIGRDHAGHLKVVKLNVDEARRSRPATASRAFPLLVFLKRGKEVDRMVGAAPEGQRRRRLEPHIEPLGGSDAAGRS